MATALKQRNIDEALEKPRLEPCGKSLVVFEPELGIATDVFPCEDGHPQERSLLSQVIETVQKNDLWVADRNFCTLGFMFGIHRKEAFFILRQHKNTPYKPLSGRFSWDIVKLGASMSSRLN